MNKSRGNELSCNKTCVSISNQSCLYINIYINIYKLQQLIKELVNIFRLIEIFKSHLFISTEQLLTRCKIKRIAVGLGLVYYET